MAIKPGFESRVVGTIQELEEMGLDPNDFRTCSRGTPGANNTGCPVWKDCKAPCKGSGPKNYGIRIFKGPSSQNETIERVVDCVWIAERSGDFENNGGLVDIIAEEGGEVVYFGGVGGKGRDMEYTKKVLPFPRPKDNPDMLSFVSEGKARLEQERRRREETREKALPQIVKRGGAKSGE